MTQQTSPTFSAQHQNVVPSEVGWQFVPQYYTFVNKQPNRLHCFYTKNSTFIHGTEGEDGRPCFGQQEIHAKILSLGFNDCKVFIHSVDAQASQGGGIIIQVIGEMSNNGEPWKKFVQTFFLAEQPNGYFVLNDIFRFLKEESVESEEESEIGISTGAQEITVAVSPVPSVSQRVDEQQPVEQEEVEPPVSIPTTAPPHSIPQVDPIPEPASALPAEEPSKPQPNGHTIEPESPQPVEPEPEPTPVPEAEPSRAVTPPPAAPATPAAPPTPTISAASPAPTAQSQPTQAPVPSAPVPAPTASPAPPPAPKTWANLAAANSKKWGAAVAQESRGTSESAVPTPPASGTQTPTSGHGTRAPAPPAHQHVHSITTPQVFVKGVNESVTGSILTKVMTERFGPLKDLDVVHSKACAFFEFHSLDSARRAIVASLPVSQGGEGGIRVDIGSGTPARITVETRKERSERPPPRARGGVPSQSVGDRGGFRGRGAPRGRGAVSGKAL